MKKLKKIVPLVVPPLGVLAVMLFTFKLAGLYPFGDGTISWCDMNQQVIPLLMDFKDILDGKDSLFLNMHNAGGMNFYGVFFFFLASPFSFLVKFVDKSDMITFVNVLLILKMMTDSFTSALYFRICRKELDSAFAVILSLMYAFCGYGMLFYQNIIWLDMMYLFPLLMISLDLLVKKQSNIMYIFVITAMLIVNYYISYMVVVFILVFMAIYVMRCSADKNSPMVCVRFISGSLIGALMSAVIWLPCFAQYLTSGRGESVTETIADANFLTQYKTVLPLLFCSAFIFAVVGINVLCGKKRTRRTNTWLMLFGLLLIPFVIEPINLMWHTGNYMSFPARYGFITIFVGLICCAEYLAPQYGGAEGNSGSKFQLDTEQFVATVGGAFLVFCYWWYSKKFIDGNFDSLSFYTSSLWGNDSSFEGNAQLFIVTAVVYGLVYILYRKRYLAKQIFVVLTCGVFAIEAVGSTRIYMTSDYVRNPDRTEIFKDETAVADLIEDDDFYRVMTDYKIVDYNMIGALGYNSLSHYTSLTDKDYMFTQKRLGYTTVWMEVGSCGGTELTNALYSVKYKLLWGGTHEDAVYTSNGYSIVETPYYLGLGLITDKDLSGCEEIPTGYTRAQVQQYVYESLLGDGKLVEEYPLDEDRSEAVSYQNGKYHLEDGSTAVYECKVTGSQILYADCFDRLSNDLSEDYFNSLTISVNGVTVCSDYPTTTNNGVLRLGEFEDETVRIEIDCTDTIDCYSFGVFGLDTAVLEQAVSGAETANLNYDGSGKITGSCVSDGSSSCVVALPYQDNFTVKVNGERVEYSKVLSDFIAFDLAEGENTIEISFTPKGFKLGAVISGLGVILMVLYLKFRKRLKVSDSVAEKLRLAVCFVSVAVMGLVYILPVILSLSN